MTDDTRFTDHLANAQPADIPDLLAIADQLNPVNMAVDAMFEDRDRDIPDLHWLKKGSKTALCGVTDNWNRLGSNSDAASSAVICALCETLRAMSKQLDMTGLNKLPPL